jgi:AhpD family alkylhydroperoxidase
MRFIEPVAPRASTGLAKRTYAQANREFGLLRDLAGNSPFMGHSPDPELLAGFWTVLYETVIADGDLARADKEAIAASVSSINRCPFCVDVHSLVGGVAGDGSADRAALASGEPTRFGDPSRRRLVEWARATRDPDAEIISHPPFGADEAPEAIGTAVAFHYVNRIVEVFQGPSGMSAGPGPLTRVMDPLVRLLAGRAIRRPHERGKSLSLLPEVDPAADLAWASASPTVVQAFARLASAVERAGRSVLSEQVRSRVLDSVTSWRGDDPGVGSGWIDAAMAEADPDSVPVLRLSLLTALAPYRLTEADVERFRAHAPGDRVLVGAVAWSAFIAARRIGGWLAAGLQPQTPRRRAGA